MIDYLACTLQCFYLLLCMQRVFLLIPSAKVSDNYVHLTYSVYSKNIACPEMSLDFFSIKQSLMMGLLLNQNQRKTGTKIEKEKKTRM